MKYLIFTIALLCAFQASAEKISGRVLRIRDNVAYIQTADGKKTPVIFTENTYFRKKKILNKGKRTINAPEFYQPLVEKDEYVTLTYDPDTTDATTGAIKASDVLVIAN